MTEELLLLPLLDESSDEVILELFKTDKKISEKQCQKFEFSSFSDHFCRQNFRFLKHDILELKRALRIPFSFSLQNQLKVGGLEALCICLRRLAYPNRFVDIMPIFPRTHCELSRIHKLVVTFIVETHGHLIKQLKHPYLTLNKMKEFCSVIHDKGAPYTHCFGFLDGTVRPMCRPTRMQKNYYNGHKRTHALKFQSVMFPNGIIGALSGPVMGRRHDAYILAESGIMEELECDFIDETGKPFFLYGDPAYPLRKNLIVPFKGPRLTPGQKKCNKRMSSVRQSVEWGFSKIIQNWAYLDYKKNLRLGLQPIGNYYKAAVILTNCHTCLYSSQTSDYFGLDPPGLHSYLQ